MARSGTRHSEKKQKLRRAGEERPLGELELGRVGKGVGAKMGQTHQKVWLPKRQGLL